MALIDKYVVYAHCVKVHRIVFPIIEDVYKRQVDERLFQTALNIKSVGKGKLSIVLFYVNPEKYVPLEIGRASCRERV